jgi:hypothetical protein
MKMSLGEWFLSSQTLGTKPEFHLRAKVFARGLGNLDAGLRLNA